jgi:hypothetical protein
MLKKKKVKKLTSKELMGEVLQKLELLNRDHVLQGRFDDLVKLIKENMEK